MEIGNLTFTTDEKHVSTIIISAPFITMDARLA